MYLLLSFFPIHVQYRFSPFVKTGSEGFILGSLSLKREPRVNEIIKIIVSMVLQYTCSNYIILHLTGDLHVHVHVHVHTPYVLQYNYTCMLVANE